VKHPLSGATRVHFIVGDPIAQVKSPAGVTVALQALGHDAVVLPAHVVPADLANWAAGVSLARNVDGLIVTVPHKFACFALCASTTERAAFLGNVNVLRRTAKGQWHGDMCDGLGFVQALQDKGCDPQGQACLLVGAGGAGSAIAHALVMAGAQRLAVHDEDVTRRAALLQRLASLGRCVVEAGSADPAGYDVVVNATPVGMKAGDPLPLRAEHLQPHQFVGCVITAPAVTPLIAAARANGCATLTGADMFAKVCELMVDFLVSH